MSSSIINVVGDYDTRHIPTEEGEIVYNAALVAHQSRLYVKGKAVICSGDVFDGGSGIVQGGSNKLYIDGKAAAHPAVSICMGDGYYSGVTATNNRTLYVHE